MTHEQISIGDYKHKSKEAQFDRLNDAIDSYKRNASERPSGDNYVMFSEHLNNMFYELSRDIGIPIEDVVRLFLSETQKKDTNHDLSKRFKELHNAFYGSIEVHGIS